MRTWSIISGIIYLIAVITFFVSAAAAYINGKDWMPYFGMALLLIIANNVSALVTMKQSELQKVDELLKLQKGRYVEGLFGKR